MKGIKTISLIMLAFLAMLAPALAEVTIEEIKIDPAKPTTPDNLTGIFNVTTNTTFKTVNVTWYNNSNEFEKNNVTNDVENGTEFQWDKKVSSADTNEGDIWTFEVYAEDEESNQTKNVSVTIPHSIEVEKAEIVTEEPKTEDDLVCEFNITTEGEIETVEAKWYNHSVLTKTDTITGYEKGTKSESILSSSDTNKNGKWKCKIFAETDEGQNDTKETGEVEIENTPPKLDISDKEVNVEEEFTLDLDDETEDPDVDNGVEELTFDWASDYEPPEGMELEDGEITWTPEIDDEGTHDVEIRYKDEESSWNTEFFEIEVKRDMLVIDRLRASCSPRRCDDDLDIDGGVIEEVKPGSTLELRIRLENLWEDDHSMRDIETTAYLEGMAGKRDQKVEEELRRIRPDDREEITLEFDIPPEADEETYLLDFEVEAEDDDGNFFEIGPIDIDVDVEKEDDRMYFKSASVFPSTIGCNRDITLNVNVKNTGAYDQSNAELLIENDELDIKETELFDVESGDYDDSYTEFKKEYDFSISDAVSSGEYDIELRAYYEEGVMYESETVTLTVEECEVTPPEEEEEEKEEEEEEEEEEEVEVIKDPELTTPPTQEPVEAEPVEEEEEVPFLESTAFIYILVAAFVILLAAVIMLAVIAFRR
ncbi:MAG: hypothetical protein ACOCZQ_01090 [Nanoarchaeota archaeon]